jgi:hypothetical protein
LFFFFFSLCLAKVISASSSWLLGLATDSSPLPILAETHAHGFFFFFWRRFPNNCDSLGSEMRLLLFRIIGSVSHLHRKPAAFAVSGTSSSSDDASFFFFFSGLDLRCIAIVACSDAPSHVLLGCSSSSIHLQN